MQNSTLNRTPKSSFSLASFNAHGVHGKETDIEALASTVEVLAVCETWLRPQDTLAASKFTESVTVMQNHNGWRAQGGVNFKVSPLIKYSLVHQHARESFQSLVIKVG